MIRKTQMFYTSLFEMATTGIQCLSWDITFEQKAASIWRTTRMGWTTFSEERMKELGCLV